MGRLHHALEFTEVDGQKVVDELVSKVSGETRVEEVVEIETQRGESTQLKVDQRGILRLSFSVVSARMISQQFYEEEILRIGKKET